MPNAPLKHVAGSTVTTVIDPRFGTGDSPTQPVGWGGGGDGGTWDTARGIVVETDYTGATDASADINAAIGAAYTAGQSVTGGPYSVPVLLKAGILRLDNPIRARRRTILLGVGRRHTILKPYGSASGIVVEVGSYGAPDDMEFGHFQIDGANQTGTKSSLPKGMFFTNARRVHVHDLWVQNTWATGIGIDFITGVIENCWATDNGRQNASRTGTGHAGCSGIGVGTTEVDGTGHQLVISGNHCNGNSNYGIFIEAQTGGSGSRGVVIVGNTCRDNGQCGIADSGGLGALITGNICVDNDRGGVGIDYGTMGVALDKGFPGIRTQVTGNVLANNQWGVLLESAGALALRAPRISGNDITANTGDGVHGVLNGTGTHENVWIDANTISGNGGTGVNLTGTATVARVAVEANRIWDNSGAAVRIATPTTASRIWGNETWSNGSGVFYDTTKTHTGHRIDTTWVEGASTLPS